VGTSTSYDPTDYAAERKCFNASGLNWVWYFNGTKIVYKTSYDSYSAVTVIGPCDYGYDFSLVFDGTHIHYARSNASISNLYYRMGTPNSNGVITWSTGEQTVDTHTDGYPSICVDSAGYPWISYTLFASEYCDPYVKKSSTKNGTWTTSVTQQLRTDYGPVYVSNVVPLTAQKVLVLYGTSASNYRYASCWNGSAWKDAVTMPGTWVGDGYFSAVNQSDYVHVVGLTYTGYNITYTKYTYSTNSFGANVIVEAGATSFSAPTLSIDTSTNNLCCFWAGYPTAKHIYYKWCISGTWDTNPTDWLDESTNDLYNDGLTAFSKDYGGKIGLEYSTKKTAPLNVKFAILTIASNNAPTNDALTLDLTGANYKGTKTLLTAKQDYKFVYKASDADGVTDITYAEIRLDYASKNVILRATRGTGDAWTFGEQSDPSNYVTLGTCSDSTSGTQKTFNFLVKINWAWGDSAETIGVRAYVIDSQSASDQDDYTNIFGVESHLASSSLTVSDYHVNPSQTLTFQGYWKYNGTNIVPPDGDYQVKIKLSGTQKGSTDSTLVSGAFSISDVTAESTVNSYSYQVFASYNASAGTFSDVIVDRGVITISANTTSPAPNAYVNFTVSAIYDYDDTPITSWTFNILRNSTHFASANFTDGGYTDLFYVYTVENMSENTYALTSFTSTPVTVYWSTYVALTIKTLDLDSNILTGAIVYFNTTQITVDSDGLATKTGLTKNHNVAVKVYWHGVKVNGTWTTNMTITKTIEASCNVWSFTINARDSSGTILSLSPSKFAWTFPNGTQVNTTKSDGSWIFKIMNGTHYYKIEYQGQWISANVTLPVLNKNVTVINKNCWVYNLTVYVTNQNNVEMSGAILTLSRTDNASLSDYGLTPKTVAYYNTTHGRYVWTQLANQTSSYTVKATATSGETNSATTALTTDTIKEIVITTTISGGPSGSTGGPGPAPPEEQPQYIPPVELPKVPGAEFNYGIVILVGVVGVAATVAVVGRGKPSLETQWKKKTQFVGVSSKKWKKTKHADLSGKWRKKTRRR